jgi:hypothetical protein
VNVIQSLRRLWRGHDEKLAEHAYQEHHESELGAVSVPIEPNPYGPVGPTTGGENAGEAVFGDAIPNEDAFEHEEPQ